MRFMSESSPQQARFGSGHPVRRIEDERLLIGAGSFADDVNAAGQAYLCFLRSPHPHARILGIDKTVALAMPGVIAIVTGADLARAGVKPLPTSPDFKRADGSATAAPPRHALAVDSVRFVGEAVAAVVGETREHAREALDAIDVSYEAPPMGVDPVDAVADGAPLVWPAGSHNNAAEIPHGNVAAAT